MSKKFIVKKDGSLLTPEFRVSFPRIFEADEHGKYGLSMIFDNDVDFSELETLIEATKKTKWPKGAPRGFMYPILDGEASDRDEHQGKYYVNGKAGKYRPGLVDADMQEIRDESEFYPGCWARAVVTTYAWEFKGKCGVSVNVRNIQKIRDDEPLISRVRAEDEFDSAVADVETGDL